MGMQTRCFKFVVATATVASGLGCGGIFGSLDATIKSEMPTGCQGYAGSAGAGASCDTSFNAELARTVLSSHCAELADSGAFAIQVTYYENAYATWTMVDTVTCDWRCDGTCP